jgi:hypothetical protein
MLSALNLTFVKSIKLILADNQDFTFKLYQDNKNSVFFYFYRINQDRYILQRSTCIKESQINDEIRKWYHSLSENERLEVELERKQDNIEYKRKIKNYDARCRYALKHGKPKPIFD